MVSGTPDVRLKLTVEYDGTAFRGWARQPGARTVEGELRHALAQLYRRVEALTVAGRTDTGVHALGNVVSVEVETGPPPERAAEALNGLLPHDLSVLEAEPATPPSTPASTRWRAPTATGCGGARAVGLRVAAVALASAPARRGGARGERGRPAG